MYLKQQKQQDQTTVMIKDGDSFKEKTVANRRLDLTGNWRVTQPIDDHNVTYMRIDHPKSDSGRQAIITTVVAILVGLVVIISIILAFVSRNWAKQVKAMEESNAAEGGQMEYNDVAQNSERKRQSVIRFP